MMMMMMIVLMFFCFSNSAFVGVIEYDPVLPPYGNVSSSTALTIMMKNVDQYELFIQNAKENGVVLIVFPEDGLYGPNFATKESIRPFLEVIPDLGAFPCHNATKASPVLSRMSCLALQYEMYIVLDMGEIAADGKQYNVAVAFDSNGKLVAKYRKSHLYYEPQFDDGNATASYFECPLLGRVGMCICFDVMFENPISRLKEKDIDLLLLPSWWVNIPPLEIGPAMFQALSRFHNVDIIAPSSGYNWYNSGSGCFAPNGVISQYYNPSLEGKSKMLICDVKTEKRNQIKKKAWFGAAGSVPALFNETRFKTEPGGAKKRVVAGSGCELEYQWSDNVSSNETFALISFVGPYAPIAAAPPLFFADICSLVVCYSTADQGCASVYVGVEGVFSRSVFSHATLTFSAPRAVQESLYWMTDGSYTVKQPVHHNAGSAASISMGNSSLTSLTFWSMKYY